jgi:hypothetical protein
VTSLSHQKEKLERQKARLQSKEHKLKTLERKQRTRRLIELGGLIVKAELDALNNNTLLGALLSLKQQMTHNETIIHEWTEQGARAFEAQSPTTESGSNTAPLVITFKTEPPRELKSQLRDLNFKWNPFRKEWYGYGEMKALSRLTQHYEAMVESCGD